MTALCHRVSVRCFRLESLMILFAALSVMDLYLTWQLIGAGMGENEIIEANPIAAWILASTGWLGMSLFKAATVTLALALLLRIARERPRTGKAICALGCVGVAIVVAYSLVLLLGNPRDNQAPPLDAAAGETTSNPV